jgi:RNA polymerase sigma factor (sigma-70 family)
MGEGFRQKSALRREALEAVIGAYEGALLRHAARLTGNASAAEDVVQNAFVKLIRRWREPLVPSPRMAAWLYRVVRNEAVDHLRREARRRALHAAHARDCAAPAAGPPACGEDGGAAEAAAAALARLSGRERLLVTLKVYEEKSYREIADLTGLSIGNVGFILHHAMRKMARFLRERRDDGSRPR